MIPLVRGVKVVQFIEKESRMGVTKGWDKGRRGNCSVGTGFQLG